MIGITTTLHATCAAAVALLLTAAAPAAAQTGYRWVDPHGVWSIDFSSSSWTYANPIPSGYPNITLIMIPRDSGPDSDTRLCPVTEYLYPDDGPPEAVRGYASQFDARHAADIFGARGQTIGSVTYSTIANVALADVTSTSGEMLHHHKVFYLPVSGQAMFVDIDCMWPRSLAPNKVGEIETILASLHIVDSGSPP